MGKTICTIEYLVGTMATAYKGLVTSLVMRNFCMLEDEGAVLLNGVVLTLPGGDYFASLIQSGIEISRARIKDGYFELRAPAVRVMEAPDLQIDIRQDGRHIGTFLLKRAAGGGFYTPAVELSEEMKGIDFTLLAGRLQGRPGLFKKAEELISGLYSAKRDWIKLSALMSTFSVDLFWEERGSFYEWLPALARFALFACENMDPAGKAADVYISLIRLPLDEEKDEGRLAEALGQWTRALEGSGADFSRAVKPFLKVVSRILQRVPGQAPAPALIQALETLRARLQKAPLVRGESLRQLRDFLPEGELAALLSVSDENREKTTAKLDSALSEIRSARRVPSELEELDTGLFDEAETLNRFFRIAEKNLSAASARAFFLAARQLMEDVFSGEEVFLPGSLRIAEEGTAGIIKKIISLGETGLGAEALSLAGKEVYLPQEKILLNREVASSVLASGDRELIKTYKNSLRRVLVPPARVRGYSSETWAEAADPRHLERLTGFMRVLEAAPEQEAPEMGDVLVHLICNVYLAGVFIPDDKIFQREISAYLNSGVFRGLFFLSYLFLKRLPVYFNEVGAASMIRDYSTRIDSWGDDPSLYFVRKQVHVNASSRNIALIERILRAWAEGDPGSLKEVLPPEVFSALDARKFHEYADAARPVIEALRAPQKKLLALSEEELERIIDGASAPAAARSKLLILCRLYREVVKKYTFYGPAKEGAGALSELSRAVEKTRALAGVVLSPEKTAAVESLFYKRHIAFGIPSVLGSYREPKFDAFGEMLRAEPRLRAAAEEMISKLEGENKNFAGTGHPGLADIAPALKAALYLIEFLGLHGLENFHVRQLDAALVSNRLRLSQVRDILRLLQKELAWEVEMLTRTIHAPLTEVLRAWPAEDLPEKLSGAGGEDFFPEKASDIIVRDLLTDAAGLTELDRLLGALIGLISSRLGSGLPDEETGENALAGERDFYLLNGIPESERPALMPALGNKAGNLAYLFNRGFQNIPHGVVFPASATFDYDEYTRSGRFRAALRGAVKELEGLTGKKFGGGLFLSVRSGSFLSMPGILTSILYCGFNDAALEGLIRETNDPWLAWDSYRRFLEHYGTAALGLPAGFFESVIRGYLGRLGIKDRDALGAAEMKGLVLEYKEKMAVGEKHFSVPGDVYEQLEASVRAVYASWYSERARQYREATGVSAHWGTSVTLMEMVYGNEPGSGASVFFTRDPISLSPGVYGETKERATGDDLVYGRFTNRPLSRAQSGPMESLEESDPGLFSMHLELALKIEEAMGGLPQEVEAAYRGLPARRIYTLQTRRMEFDRGFLERFADICGMQMRVIARGIGAHGGALSGVAALTGSVPEIRRLKEKTGMPVILLRDQASTDDVSLMPEVEGIITSEGGVTSHGAVLAQKFGLSAVVGCSGMKIITDGEGRRSALMEGFRVEEGAPLSMDGSSGLVYYGICMERHHPKAR